MKYHGFFQIKTVAQIVDFAKLNIFAMYSDWFGKWTSNRWPIQNFAHTASFCQDLPLIKIPNKNIVQFSSYLA